MKICVTSADILQALCKNSRKWGIYFYGADTTEHTEQEIDEAAPWLKILSAQNKLDVLVNQCGYLLFNTEDEMNKIYNQTVSDDHPKGKLPHIYMLTCDPSGTLLTENT